MNLLPQEGKRRVRYEYGIRFAAATLWLLTSVVVFGSVFLLPSFFLSQSRVIAIAEQGELTERAVALQEKNNTADELVSAKALLTVAKIVDAKPAVVDVVQKILDEKDAAITITSLAYNKISGETELRVSGVAATRDALTSFSDRLERESIFEIVDLPVSSFVKERDLSFVVTISGDF